MPRTLGLLLASLLVGCGGSSASGDGSVSLYFSNEQDFAPSSFGFTTFDKLEGSRDDGLNVYLENGVRTLEIDLPSGRTTDLENDLQASVFSTTTSLARLRAWREPLPCSPARTTESGFDSMT